MGRHGALRNKAKKSKPFPESIMSTTVIGLYKDSGSARKAMEALVKAGCREDDIDIFGGRGTDADKIVRELMKHGFEKSEAEPYGVSVEQGHTLVAAHMADESADAAEAILDENGAVDPEEIAKPER